MTGPDRLRQLAAQATPGPAEWRAAEARLIALAPDLAILCADLADLLDELKFSRSVGTPTRAVADALLARVDQITGEPT
jgi:hypothetical protein